MHRIIELALEQAHRLLFVRQRQRHTPRLPRLKVEPQAAPIQVARNLHAMGTVLGIGMGQPLADDPALTRSLVGERFPPCQPMVVAHDLIGTRLEQALELCR